MANRAGTAELVFGIPTNPWLLGRSLHQQAKGLDPDANPAGAILSNGASITFGAR